MGAPNRTGAYLFSGDSIRRCCGFAEIRHTIQLCVSSTRSECKQSVHSDRRGVLGAHANESFGALATPLEWWKSFEARAHNVIVFWSTLFYSVLFQRITHNMSQIGGHIIMLNPLSHIVLVFFVISCDSAVGLVASGGRMGAWETLLLRILLCIRFQHA